MKKLAGAIILFVLLCQISVNTVSAACAEYSWFIKRNGNCQPELTAEQKIIYNYDGYYLDRRLSDDDNKKILYLTFDCGYENGNVEKILDVLKTENVPAAFFVLDNIILKNTDLVTRMNEDGHLVCNHTKNHKNISNLSYDEIKNNLSALEMLYEEKTGNKMDKFFRFPEGRYSEEALSSVQKLGYKTIFWSFAYADWDNHRQPSVEKAIKKILDNTHNGAVILLHPNSETNAVILPALIRKWREMGYEFGTLYQLTEQPNEY